ncbi:MAG: sigma-70 family RNA polymerase sigma factor [Clostridiales bacterium]|nr:sigma-70 family RNA polymerase sigma factor [Clostridiales bacterium]
MENSIFEDYAELVKRFNGGEQEAFDGIYEKSVRFVYATCLGILGDPEDARDAMQETYISVYNNIGSLSDGKTFVSWIKRIAVNKSTDMIRKKKGETYYDDAIATEEILEGNDNLEDLPDHYIVEKSKRDTLLKILKSELSDVQYQTVFLHYYDEMPVDEIASVMRCPEGTVKTRLKSSRILIRKAVEKYEKESGDSLRGMGAVPFLTALFRTEATGLQVPDISSSIGPGPRSSVKPGSLSEGEATKAATKAAAKAAGKAGSAAGKASAAKAGGAAVAKAGFLSTGIGKAVAVVAAAAILVPAGISVKGMVDDSKGTGNKAAEAEDEVTKITETSASETVIETTEATVTETVPEPTETEPSETEAPVPYDVPLEELPDSEQLRRLISRWDYHEYDHSAIPDDFVLRSFFGNGLGCQVDLSYYFDDYDGSFGFSDPEDLFSGNGGCHRVAYDQLVWVEENVLSISPEDVDRINGNITVTNDGSYNRGGYVSDGYLWYSNGGSGEFTLCEQIINASTDGQYYYLTTLVYDDLMVENNPSFNPARDGLRYDYVMEYRGTDNSGVWSILSCTPSSSTYSPSDLLVLLPEAYSCPDTGWKAAYADVVTSLSPEDFDNGYHAGDYGDMLCGLVLINDDDIPELIVSVSVPDGVVYGRLYTFIDGETVFLRSMYGYPETYNTYAPRRNCIVNGGGPEENGGFFFTFIGHMTDDLRSIEHITLIRANFDMLQYEHAFLDPNAFNGTVRYYYCDPSFDDKVEITEEEFYSLTPGDEAKPLVGNMTVENFLEAVSVS